MYRMVAEAYTYTKLHLLFHDVFSKCNTCVSLHDNIFKCALLYCSALHLITCSYSLFSELKFYWKGENLHLGWFIIYLEANDFSIYFNQALIQFPTTLKAKTYKYNVKSKNNNGVIGARSLRSTAKNMSQFIQDCITKKSIGNMTVKILVPT